MSENLPKTELLYKKSKPIDHLSTLDGILLMANEQNKAAIEVKIIKEGLFMLEPAPLAE